MNYYLGLMSGTSMDGIDAAIVEADSQRLVQGLMVPYSATVKAQLTSLSQLNLSELYQLNTLIGREFAAAALALLKRANLPAQAISAIGSHGQTLLHDAQASIPYTIQLGCAHTIAEMTGLPVIADFRTRDLVIGGQGAPLAPLYHHVLFANLGYPLAVVNVGGIANVSVLLDRDTMIGYDVGPGNCLMDAWVNLHQQKVYDAEGAWAKEGVVIEDLLQALLQDPYLHQSFPKSIGKEYFSLRRLQAILQPNYKPVNVQATLLRYTAATIASALKQHAVEFKQILVCGGGAHNKALVSELAALLRPMKVLSTESISINPDFIEAQMMGWLAQQMLENKPLNLAPITGAAHKAILGVLYPAGIDQITRASAIL